MLTDPKPTASQARDRANAAEALVRDLRRMLGRAMAEAAEAKRIAREAEREAG